MSVVSRWIRLLKSGNDHFSRWHEMAFRVYCARRTLDRTDKDGDTPTLPRQARDDVAAHIFQAERILASRSEQPLPVSGSEEPGRRSEDDGRTVVVNSNETSFEVLMRHTFLAERTLVPLMLSEGLSRGLLLADIRKDIEWYVPTPERKDLKERIVAVIATFDEDAGRDGSPHVLDEVVFIKDSIDQIVLNGYRKRERMRDDVYLFGLWLFVFDLMIIVTTTIAAYWGNLLFPVGEGPLPDGRIAALTIWVGFAFGAVGSCFSGLMNSLLHDAVRHPFAPGATILIRPLVGGTSGIIAALLTAAGLLQFGHAVIPGLAIVAFAFGFSERLVLRTVDGLNSGEEVGRPPGVSRLIGEPRSDRTA